MDTKQPPLSTDTSVYRNPWSPRELSTNIKEMGEEVTFDQAVTPPEDLRLNYRGLAIVNHLRENNASRSRYLEQLEISLGNSRRHCNTPEAVMNDVLGDGNCAYRAIVLGLEQLELSNTPASERQSVSIMNDNDEVLDVVRSMKNSMFDTMMLAVTGVDLAIDGDHAAECRLLTLEGYNRATYLELLEYFNDPGFREPHHLGVITPSRTTATVGWMRAHLSWLKLQDNMWLRYNWFSVLSHILGKNILVYEPVGGSQAVCPYSAITNNSMFFDTVESEFISLMYHQSGSPYLSRSKGPDDGLPHAIYNHFGQLTIDEQHFEKVKAEILEAAHACGTGAEKTSLILHTKTETSGGTGAVGSGISSETRDGGTGGKGLNAGKSGSAVTLSVGQNNQAQCRARVGRARKKGPDIRPRCTKQEQKVGSGLCGYHKNVPTKKPKNKVTRDRSRRGVGEGSDSDSGSSSSDDCKPYYGEEKPLQGEAMGKSPSVPDEMAKIIASSKGIAEQAYREVYVDIGCAKQSPDKAMEQGCEPAGGSAAKRWTDEFPEADMESKEWKNRHLMDGRDRCSPTDETMRRLPGIDTVKDQNLILGPLWQLAAIFFFTMFPSAVFEYILEQTNDYWRHCTMTHPSEVEARENNQTAGHRKQNGKLGNARTPAGGYTLDQLMGAIGIMLMSGIVNTKRMSLHWSLSPNYNFPRVRNCMKRDEFYLLYSRHLRLRKSPGPGPQDAAYDTKYHIRYVEEKLNAAWSSTMRVGKWVSFDEQMVKCTALFSRGIQRYNPLKPIKHGIKCWAACCVSGYCYVSCVDGGFTGDKELKKWAKDPLGRTTRMVLWVLLHACEAFAVQLRDSGVHVAMDNYFSSPILMGCLATHLIFAVGTLRSNRAGVGGALATWTLKKVQVTEKGAMAFLRWGNMSITQWVDKKKVFFLSTVHIFKSDTEPQDYPRKQRGSKEKICGPEKQPPVRHDYCGGMGGVDVSDQKAATYICPHRPMNYFWRRVFEHLIMQAIVNAFILFEKWRSLMIAQVDERIAEMTSRKEDTGIQLRLKARLEQLKSVAMLQWVEAIADHLMSQCKNGNADAGGGRSRKRKWDTVKGTAGQWFDKGFKGGSKCFNRTNDKKFCVKETRGVCGCNKCKVGEKGGFTRTRICSKCCSSPESHERASLYAAMKLRKNGSRKLTPIPER